jgi:hypothetical protein
MESSARFSPPYKKQEHPTSPLTGPWSSAGCSLCVVCGDRGVAGVHPHLPLRPQVGPLPHPRLHRHLLPHGLAISKPPPDTGCRFGLKRSCMRSSQRRGKRRWEHQSASEEQKHSLLSHLRESERGPEARRGVVGCERCGRIFVSRTCM